jgi:arginyl-tRNA synthetase
MDIRKKLVLYLEKQIDLSKEEINLSLEVPSNSEFGDFALPCFILSKIKKENPNKISIDLAKKLKLPSFIEKVESKGIYLNFYVKGNLIVKEALDFNPSFKPKKEKIMVEFSQPNTHKSFHIGHLRNVLIGDSLVRILKFNGYNVTPVNYIGDIGTHVAKSIWYLENFVKKYPKEDYGTWLGELYSKANLKLGDNKEYKEEVDLIHKKLDDEDKRLTKLWQKTRKWSLDEFNKIYKELDVHFDKDFFESEIIEDGKKIVKDLLKKKIAKYDQGSVLVDLGKLKVFLILKSDGTPLYSTKDLALAKLKFEKYKIDKNIYVVGSEQEFYFKQLFKTLEIMGFKNSDKCVHISYGLVQLSDGKMSSRLGNVINYFDFSSKVKKDASYEIEKRHKDWSQSKIKKTSEIISMAAIKFTMLGKDTKKFIKFNVKESLSFEGESGPYIQYVYTRIQSIINKSKIKTLKADVDLLNHPLEKQISNKILEFSKVVEKITKNYQINLLGRYLLDLSQLFNEYYQNVKILDEDQKTQSSRLTLIKKVQQIIKQGLELLGINVVEEM